MNLKNQKGFTLVESLLVILILAVIGFAGYYVWHSQHSSKLPVSNSPSKASTEVSSNNSKPVTESLSETYSNSDFGFSFKYPASWKLIKNLQDYSRGAPEGEIYAQSPGGIKVHFDPGFGGKGGDCADDQANYEHTTRTCSTMDTLSIDQFSTTPKGDKLYFYTTKWTEPTRDGGAVSYFAYIGCGQFAPTTKGSEMGYMLKYYEDISCIKQGAVTSYVEYPSGTDASQASFLNSDLVKQATPVLKSFTVLPD